MDHAVADDAGDAIYPLEWIVRAIDAARLAAENEETGRFRLDFSQLYSDQLGGL